MDEPAGKHKSNDPLHGVTLEMMLTRLVEKVGWGEMSQKIKIRCFTDNPSISSSLKFCRKTPWAREKVERLYLQRCRPRAPRKRPSPPRPSPPPPSSYWVQQPGLLAGAYPGDPDPELHRKKIQALVGAGVRAFVNLMEEDEIDHSGRPFSPYDADARAAHVDATCVRFPIRDQSIPTREEMVRILDAIDRFVEAGKTVYVHCWGGIGRTGTVVACWLLRHRLASQEDVFGTLTWLRRQDRERSHKASPENDEQRNFVRSWDEGEPDPAAPVNESERDP